MQKVLLTLVVAILVATGPGCREASISNSAPTAPTTKKTAVVKSQVRPTQPPQSQRQRSLPPTAAELEALERAFETSRSTALTTGSGDVVAVKQVGRAIEASLEIAPTLVVWLIDRTESSQHLSANTAESAKAYYDSPELKEVLPPGEQKLLTVVASFDESLKVLTDSPTDDIAQIKTAFDAATRETTNTPEKTFTAIKQLLDKYETFRTEQMREVMFVVVTDEAGDDQAQVDSLIEPFRRLMIPVYVIGVPAPWGQTNPFGPLNAEVANSMAGEKQVVHGPESRQSERVEVTSWHYAFSYESQVDLKLVDSGFGPFALERLCRESSGMFFPVRPSGMAFDRFGSSGWPSGSEVRFDPNVVKRYAPDYVSKEDYEQLLAENKARKAVVDAAKLGSVEVDGQPTTSFTKRDEAQMTRQLNTAQQFAAKNSPKVDRLYEVLQAGEGDRERLKDPRWQAEYDLAIGRAAALKVRIDGYNAMIAALKRGKNFENPNSTEWILEAGETIETGSALQRLADKAKSYLERVAKEHPGTPWARIAEQELKNPLGWSWREA